MGGWIAGTIYRAGVQCRENSPHAGIGAQRQSVHARVFKTFDGQALRRAEVVGKDGVISNLGLVKRISPNLIIAFDSDSAGRKAGMRAANIALSLGMDVKIADIEGGKDPADLVLTDVEAWKKRKLQQQNNPK